MCVCVCVRVCARVKERKRERDRKKRSKSNKVHQKCPIDVIIMFDIKIKIGILSNGTTSSMKNQWRLKIRTSKNHLWPTMFLDRTAIWQFGNFMFLVIWQFGLIIIWQFHEWVTLRFGKFTIEQIDNLVAPVSK